MADKIVNAIKTLANDAEGGVLLEKPNVKDIEKLIGNISADQRDVAWKAYESDPDTVAKTAAKAKADAEAKAAEEAKAKAKADANGEKMVSNKSKNKLEFRGVVIAPGESKSVPGFDAKHAVMKAWIDKGVISI